MRRGFEGFCCKALALVELPPGYTVRTMQREYIAAVAAAVPRWYRDITYGVNSAFLREDIYCDRRGPFGWFRMGLSG